MTLSRRSIRPLLTALAVAPLTIGCGGSPISPAQPERFLRFTVDGEAHEASLNGTFAQWSGSTLRVWGVNCRTHVGVEAYAQAESTLTPGTYPIRFRTSPYQLAGAGSDVWLIPDFLATAYVPEWGPIYVQLARTDFGSGSVIVTAMSDAEVEGSFSMELVSLHGTGARTLVQGAFRLPMTPQSWDSSVCAPS
jgi:hypothetical protein